MRTPNGVDSLAIVLLVLAVSAGEHRVAAQVTFQPGPLAWSVVPGILGLGEIRALAVFNDGSGPALYAGGTFTVIGGVLASRVARWNGISWSALGSGVGALSPTASSEVNALTVHNDGTGDALYAGGRFDLAGGLVVNDFARWSGAAWSPVAGGLTSPLVGAVVRVNALASHHDGLLYAGGSFDRAGGSVVVGNIARWNGSSWSAAGSISPPALQGAVNAHSSVLGSNPYAGGAFTAVAIPNSCLTAEGICIDVTGDALISTSSVGRWAVL